MEYLFLGENKLTGSIHLTHLPGGLHYLDISGNKLCGSLRFDSLPNSLRTIKLEDNVFTGSFIATDLSPNIEVIRVFGNQFNAIAVIDSKTNAEIDLRGTGVTSVIDENGDVGSERFCFAEIPQQQPSLLGWLCPNLFGWI